MSQTHAPGRVQGRKGGTTAFPRVPSCVGRVCENWARCLQRTPFPTMRVHPPGEGVSGCLGERRLLLAGLGRWGRPFYEASPPSCAPPQVFFCVQSSSCLQGGESLTGALVPSTFSSLQAQLLVVLLLLLQWAGLWVGGWEGHKPGKE